MHKMHQQKMHKMHQQKMHPKLHSTERAMALSVHSQLCTSRINSAQCACFSGCAGATYITYKGVVFVLRSLAANIPQVKELSVLLQQAVQAVQAAISRSARS
jgi:hypothetical protein